MVGSSASEVVFIAVTQSITMAGKAWLIIMLFLRVVLLLFAGFPLYQDEQERFVCNTIQPGCANVCYDIFSPISLFRFWLVQLVSLSLPFTVFIIYVVHKVTSALRVDLHKPNSLTIPQLNTEFTGAYFLQLLFRTLLEAGFGVAHYYLFGFYIPKRFLCDNSPCTTQVDCYISRPTEKTVMLNFMLGVAAFSILLNVVDFFCTVKRSVRQKVKKKQVLERIYEEECLSSSKTKDQNSVGVEHFRKRHGSKCSNRGCDQGKVHSESRPCSPGITTSNNNGNNGYLSNQEEDLEREGSDVALCPPGTPRSIRVSKRGRLKPPPPPRRDVSGELPAPDREVPTITTCSKRGGTSTLELNTGLDTQPNDEEKRSEWV